MPQSKPLTSFCRRTIYFHWLRGVDAFKIYNFVLAGELGECTFKHVQKLMRFFEVSSNDTIDAYLEAKQTNNRGRKRLNHYGDIGACMKELYDHNPFCTMEFVRLRISEILGTSRRPPSFQALYRMKKDLGITRKKASVINLRQCPIQQAAFMDDMKYFHEDQIKDFDETSCGRGKFELLYGQAPSNKRVLKHQWEIGGNICSVIACYTVNGFVAWRIFYETVNQHSVQLFLNADLAPMMREGDVIIVDGASVHKTVDSLAVLENISRGMYRFSAPYSPHLKPVERGFSLVWQRIRDRCIAFRRADIGEEECTNLINEAFTYYSPIGGGKESCRGHWQLFRDNHKAWWAS